MQIPITDEAHRALRKVANNLQGGRRQSNGDWLITVDNEVLAALEARLFPGETYSDCIVRLAAGRAS